MERPNLCLISVSECDGENESRLENTSGYNPGELPQPSKAGQYSSLGNTENTTKIFLKKSNPKAHNHQTHSPSIFVPLLVISCDPLEEEGLSGFGCFHPFCTGFFPSLWIYLPMVFVVGDFEWTSFLLMINLFLSVFLVFLLTGRPLCCNIAGGSLQMLLT